jgi:membrane protease YdiL (CAAX protease family)
MPTVAERSWNLVETLAFSAFVATYIWLLQARYKYLWIVFLVWLFTSFFFHQDTAKTLGWRADNLWPAGKQAASFFVPCILALCIIGLLLGGLYRSSEHLLVPQKFFGYMSFCLLQQVGLNSYVTNRLLAATDPIRAALLAGALFGALHWPNPVLVPVTWFGGTAMSWLFARQRNILPLAIFQGLAGTLVWWAFPVVWHHGMRVGPGFYSFHPR